MLCPFCQQSVVEFEATADAALGLRCPLCGEEGVPALYPQDYDQHPAVAVSICGPSGHGKTVFVEALLTHLERAVRWPRFSFQWMDEAGMREARQRLHTLRGHGQLPDATRAIFHRPQVIRLRNIPTVGGCQLLLYDTGGEAFGDAELLSKVGRYVRNSPAVLWLVSLPDLEYPEQVSDLMTVYANAMVRMGADPRRQTVIVVLTKGDLLVDASDLPEPARAFLLDDRLEPGIDSWRRLESVSAAIEAWLSAGDQRNLVNLLHDQFRQVRYCIVSAQGVAARDQVLPVRLMPRGVLAPLFWLWRESLPIAWVDPGDGGDSVPHFSLPAAVDAAPARSTVRLSAPAYSVPPGFVICKSVVLLGSGPQPVELRGTGGGAVLMIDAPGAEVTLSRVTIRHEGLAPADVVLVRQGRAVFHQCTIQGGIAGPEAQESAGDGMRVEGGAAAALQQCTVEFNQGNGLAGRGLSRLSVSSSRVLKNRGCGIFADGAEVDVTAVEVVDNGGAGIHLAAAVRAKVHRSTCSRNTKSGVLVVARAMAELHGNGVHDNGAHGIAAKNRAVVALQDNTCRKNGGAGIAVIGQVTGEIAGNQCRENRAHGIALEEDATAGVSGNCCEHNRRSGISYAGTAGGRCTNNTCDGNLQHGMKVAGEAAPQVDGNSCTGNGACGFLVTDQAAPVFGRDNAATDNEQADYRPDKLAKRRWFG